MKRRLFFITLLMLFCTTMFGQQHWTMSNSDIVDYPLNTTVTCSVTIEGQIPQNITDLEIGAFHNNVLRGVAKPVSNGFGGYIVYLKVYSGSEGEIISFKLYNPATDKEYDTDYTIRFSNNIVGDLFNPVQIDFYSMHWSYNNNAENYMAYPCVIKIDGVIQNNPNLEIAAFINDELCGVAKPALEPNINIYMATLKIYGTNGQTINFKLFDPSIGEDGDELETVYTETYNYDYNGGIVEIDFRNEAVAQIGDTYYKTLADAFAAVQNNQTITLITDVELSSAISFTKDITFTIDGDGKTIKPAVGSTETNSAFNLGQGNDGTVATRIYTIKNIVFDGWTTDHVVRLQGVNATVEGCTFQNCNQADGLGLLTLTFCESNVKDCDFLNNTCVKAIDINSWGDNSEKNATIENCVFDNNECNTTAVIYRAAGPKLVVKNSKFLNNKVSATGNAATLYAGWATNDEITGCYFANNTVTTSHATTKRFASAIFCDGCTVTGNAFEDNTATRNGETITTTVAVGAYYGAANVSENYWGGDAPEAGVDYTVEFTSKDVVVKTYYKEYDATAGTLSELTRLPWAEFKQGYAGYVGDTETRENISVDLWDVYADNSVVVKIYSADNTLLSTTTLRTNNREDNAPIARPVVKETFTANVVVWGKLSGSWDTEWHVAPSVEYIPNKFEVWCDGVLCDTFVGFNYVDAYMALDGVLKVAKVTNGETITYYASLEKALKALTENATLTLLDNVTIAENWDCRSNGAKITVPVTIDGNDKTLKLTGIVNDSNWNTVFRIENVATVKNLTIDVTEATGVQRCITTNSSIVADNCTFLGTTNTRYGIIVGEGAGNNIGNVTANINKCNFTNIQAGVSDNANGQDAKSFTITESNFNNADVVISAAENVTFNKNVMSNNSYVDIRSYAHVGQLQVEANDNTLQANTADNYNQIIAKLENIDAQEGFLTPVAEIDGKYYVTLQDAFDKGGNVKVLTDISLAEGVTVAEGKTVVLDLNGKKISRDTEAAISSAAITNNGNLTIKDEVGGGKVTAFAANPDTQAIPYYASNTITNCGVLTVLSGTIENSTGDEARAAFPIDNNSTSRDAIVNIEGGTITGRGAIRQFANSNTNKNEVNVKGGTVTGTSYAIWVQNPGSGDPKASLNIEGGKLSKILMDPNANFEGSITGGTITGVAIWEADTTNPDRNPSGFIKGGTFSTDVTEFCAEGFTAKPNADGTYDVRFADYIVLPTGMDESNYETLFGTNTVTDGTNYYASLQAAVAAVNGNADAILYCKPGADVGSLQHAPVTNTLTVYGNGAFVSGDSERDFDLGNTDPSGGKDITSDMTLTVMYLDGCGAWGTKATEHTVNLVFENCYNMGKAFITGTTGTLNITMNNCAFEGVISEALYSNADGTIALTNVAFSNLNKAINLNHKAAGTQTVTLENCTFTKCGNDVAADQIPVRVLSSVPGGKSELTVTSCTFTGTPAGGADILLDYGIGITTATVSNTAANVVVEREANKEPEKTTTSAAQTYTFDNRPYVAKVGEVSYKTIAEALAAVQDGGTITLINNVTEEFAIDNTTANITLDMAGFTLNGNIQPSKANLTIKNGTINNENASYSAIEINAGTLVLNDVKVTSKRHGVRIDGAVTATIEGGEYRLSATSGTRHAVNVSGAANVTIKAGTFVGPKGTTMDSGSAVCVQAGAKVTIEGGDFSGGKNATLGVSGTMTVTGGTFDQDPSEYVAEGYLCGFNQETERYEVTMGVASVTQNGSTTYYRTLAEAITAVGSGEVVINLHANATLDYNAREAYGKAETTSLTINGDGNTLTLNQKDSDWSSFGLANADAKVVFNNMIIEKTGYGDTSGAWNTHAIIFSSNVEMTNVTVNNSMAVQDGATLNNVTINEANGYYGLWINGNGQSVTMNGGSINATNGGRGIKIADEYVGDVKQVTLNVTGTTFNTAKKAAVLVSSTAGAKVTANGCDITDVAEDSINFVWVDEEWAAYYTNVKVYEEATKTQENEESFPIKVYKSDVNGTVRAYFKNLDELFAAKSTQIPLSDNYIELRGNVVANNKVNVSCENNYYYNFGTSVENGVTMTFNYADNWNMLPHFGLGENITMNVPYLQVIGGDISIAGTLNTRYLYLYGTGEGVVIEETGVVNANVSNDKTVQVKGGTVLTVKGELNTSTLNVWTQDVNNSKLIVSGTDAQVTASHIHAWNGKDGVSSQEIIVESGALLTAEKLQADRGSIVTVDAATLTATTLTLGYEGNIGTLVVKNDGVITNGIVISSVESTVSGPENLTVTSGVDGYGVNYFNGVYSLVEIEIQETELFKGWNWFSAYVDINGEEGLTKVQNALAGNATLMKSHTAYGTYYNGDWYNNGGEGLSSASVTEMYMIQMETAMTGENIMKLEGNLVNPSEHTIQLNQNWNWIGYPSNKPINLENAFNGFTPQNGDRIKSHVGFSQYYGEGSNDFGITGWWGTLNAMTPGLGYMYYRADEGTASFTYNVPADGAKSELRANITADDNYWVPATHRYANNMTMVAMLEGANADNYEVAAFVDGEVRGSARPVYVEPLDAYMFFLTIYGDEVEEMSFRCYDLATGEEYAINDRINYSVDAMLGSIEEPYMFRGTVGIGEATLSEINIYPNPTTTGREISFDATCETVEVFNTLGVKVAEYHYVDTIDAFETAGIYMIRITNNGNVQNCRVVVK